MSLVCCRLVYEEDRSDGYKQRDLFTNRKTKLVNNAREDKNTALGKTKIEHEKCEGLNRLRGGGDGLLALQSQCHVAQSTASCTLHPQTRTTEV